jgi:hypothetical protein
MLHTRYSAGSCRYDYSVFLSSPARGTLILNARTITDGEHGRNGCGFKCRFL